MKRACTQEFTKVDENLVCEFSRQVGTSYVTFKNNYLHMKTPKHSLLFFLAINFIVLSCNKTEKVLPTSELDASKTTSIKKGEPVMFKYGNIPTSSIVEWTITPAEGVNLTENGNIATAKFAKQGNYTVMASYNNAVSKTDVHVNDSAYVPPAENTLIPLSNEKITVTAIINDSSSSGKPDIVLILNFKTSKKYSCLNNYLVTKQDLLSYPIITITGVYNPDSRFCAEGEKEAEGGITLLPDPNAKSSKLVLILEGKSYEVSYYVTNKQLHIHYPNTDGFIFNNAIEY